MPKYVPASKFQELKGLDRISQMVHEMQCIWREISKDDIGIDGEIDLLEPRSDGKGAIATGKIIKVQAKSGSSYVKQDSTSSFITPIRQEDLELWTNANYPVIFIVYHPDDDKLYWKDVKEYVRATPNIFQPPIKFMFNKETDEFTAKFRDKVLQIGNVSSPRVLFQKQERLFSNLFLLQRAPKDLYNAPVRTNLDYSTISSILHGRQSFTPPFCVNHGRIYTLSELTDPDCVLREFCEASKIQIDDAQSWWSDPDLNRSYVSMLNRLLRMHCNRCGIRYNQQYKRFYFPRNDEISENVKVSWTNQRTKSHATRTVAQYYEYGYDHFWRHLAVDMKFKYFSSSWFLQIIPKYLFTVDGVNIWNTDKVGSYTTRQKARERNPHVLNHVLFWADFLSKGKSKIDIELDHKSILIIEKMPQTGITDFAITDDPAIYEEPPEVIQPNLLTLFLNSEEDDFLEEEQEGGEDD